MLIWTEIGLAGHSSQTEMAYCFTGAEDVCFRLSPYRTQVHLSRLSRRSPALGYSLKSNLNISLAMAFSFPVSHVSVG